MVAKTIWFELDKITNKYFAVTRYAKNLYLDTEALQVLVVKVCDKSTDIPDHIFNNQGVKVLTNMQIQQFGQIFKLFEANCIKFKSKKMEGCNEEKSI